MTREERVTDPYTTAPLAKSKGGPMLRMVILAGLLATTAIGWTYFSSQNDSQGLTPVAEDELSSIDAPQQLAAAESVTTPEALPQAAPAPVAAPAPRAAPRRASAPPAAAPEAVPPPSTTVAPANPAPVEPTPQPM